MRAHLLITVTAVLACSRSVEMRDTTQGLDTPVGVVTMGTPVDSTPPMPAPSPLSPAEAEAWGALGDSVMRVHLERSLFVSPPGHAPNIAECAGDAGGDNPPTALAAARWRIIGRDSIAVTWAYDYQGDDTIPMRSTTYTIEVTSAARMVPNWIAGLTLKNDTIPGDEAYVMEVGARVDTVRILLEHVMRPEPTWHVCDPIHPASAAGYGFWTFVHAEQPWPKAIAWKPEDASWALIRQLAESLTRP